jgi:hypothetical protein
LLYSNSSIRNPQIDIRNPQIDSSIRNPQTDLPGHTGGGLGLDSKRKKTFVVFEEAFRIQIFILRIQQFPHSNLIHRTSRYSSVPNPRIDSSIRNPEIDLP